MFPNHFWHGLLIHPTLNTLPLERDSTLEAGRREGKDEQPFLHWEVRHKVLYLHILLGANTWQHRGNAVSTALKLFTKGSISSITPVRFLEGGSFCSCKSVPPSLTIFLPLQPFPCKMLSSEDYFW